MTGSDTASLSERYSAKGSMIFFNPRRNIARRLRGALGSNSAKKTPFFACHSSGNSRRAVPGQLLHLFGQVFDSLVKQLKSIPNRRIQFHAGSAVKTGGDTFQQRVRIFTVTRPTNPLLGFISIQHTSPPLIVGHERHDSQTRYRDYPLNGRPASRIIGEIFVPRFTSLNLFTVFFFETI